MSRHVARTAYTDKSIYALRSTVQVYDCTDQLQACERKDLQLGMGSYFFIFYEITPFGVIIETTM